MHKLLERQLRKHYADGVPPDPALAGLLTAVEAAYVEGDSDHALLERAIELTSTELFERNRQLQRELESIQRLELELRQAEKLRAVGQLAAGVAHEINTPIQFVGDGIHFLKDAFSSLVRLALELRNLDRGHELAPLAGLRRLADEIELDFLIEEVPNALEQTSDGVRRVAGIVRALKDFGRADSGEKSLGDVNRCLESTLLVAQNELKYVAEVELSLAELPLVPCFPGELNQVILNLLINAAHAIGERHTPLGSRGLIRVKSELAGNRVLVTLSDNGAGIPLEHQPRIFEPFFTTKPVGSGTGQGLAIARSIIVEKHGGSLAFESTPGEGTTFRLSLPLAAQPTAERRPTP